MHTIFVYLDNIFDYKNKIMNSNSKVTENPQSKKAQIVLFKGEKKRADQSKESK